MTAEKNQFIESYILKLEEAIQDENSCSAENSECYTFRIIDEVISVLSNEVPEIDKFLDFTNGSAVSDAQRIIGKLRLYLLNNENDNSTRDGELTSNFENDMRELQIEFPGIKSIIGEYTNNGNIINYLNQLENAIKSSDISVIQYCIKEIDGWYKQNISVIHANNFVFDKDSHDECLRKVNHFNESFSKYNATVVNGIIRNNERTKRTNEPIIFLSHKSDDKKYANALRNFIIGLGLKNNQLIYTSHQLHKIPLDKNIYDYLRENINKNIFMIILWSDKYLESPACLNEMGAVWVTQSDYTNIYVPTFSFGNPKYHECAVDTRKMGAVLNGDPNCKASMIELKNKIKKMFNLTVDEQTESYLLDQFMREITDIQNGV